MHSWKVYRPTIMRNESTWNDSQGDERIYSMLTGHVFPSLDDALSFTFATVD